MTWMVAPIAAVLLTQPAAASPAEFRNLCYEAPSTDPRMQGLTMGQFLDRGKQRGAFHNILITGRNGRYTLRLRLGDLSSSKLLTMNYEEGPPSPECKAAHSAVPTAAKLNFETLNSANLYLLVAMLNAMAFGDLAR